MESFRSVGEDPDICMKLINRRYRLKKLSGAAVRYQEQESTRHGCGKARLRYALWFWFVEHFDCIGNIPWKL